MNILIPTNINATNANENTNSVKWVDTVIGGSPMDKLPVHIYFWPVAIFWAVVIIFINRRFWSKQAHALKTAKTTAEQREAFHQIGFWRYVLIAGALQFGLIFGIVMDSLLAISDKTEWDVISEVFWVCVLLIGPLFGLLVWCVMALYYKFKKTT